MTLNIVNGPERKYKYFLIPNLVSDLVLYGWTQQILIGNKKNNQKWSGSAIYTYPHRKKLQN